jgi:hypothetical protein
MRKDAFKKRLGMAGYVSILATLRDIPTTTRGLAEMGVCGRTAASVVVPAFHYLGLVHISGWQQRYRCASRPEYKLGEGTDAPPPLERKTGRPVKAVVPPIKTYFPPPEVRAFYRAWEALHAPISMAGLMAETGMAQNTIRSLIAALRLHNMARIDGYERQTKGGIPIALYVLGRKKDAKRPVCEKRETDARWRAKRRQLQMLQLMSGDCANDDSERAAA